MGVSASGNRAQMTGITINRIRDGKISESWSVYDALGMMQRIGAIPAPHTAGA